MATYNIDTEEISRRTEASKDFVAALQSSLFECGKRREQFTYLFLLLGAFFFLCDYLGANKVSFLGSDFTFERGHLYLASVLILSIIYLYSAFLMLHESNILWVIDASYNALRLPKTYQNDKILSMVMYPSPLSYTLYSSRGDRGLWNIILTSILGIFSLMGHLALLVYFSYKGIRALGFIQMLMPLSITLMCIIVLIRTLAYSGWSYTHISEENEE